VQCTKSYRNAQTRESASREALGIVIIKFVLILPDQYLMEGGETRLIGPGKVPQAGHKGGSPAGSLANAAGEIAETRRALDDPAFRPVDGRVG
jgi:hypothetical protein